MSIVNDGVNTTRTPILTRSKTATETLKEVKWSYNMPITGELSWNTIIIVVTIVLLILSRDEDTKVPLRAWLIANIVHCFVHMVCTYIAYRSLRETSLGMVADPNNVCNNISNFVETVNKLFAMPWWIVGLYWVILGGHKSAKDAPMLFWLTTTFLAFKLLFFVLAMMLACMVCIGGIFAFYLACNASDFPDNTDADEQRRVENLA